MTKKGHGLAIAVLVLASGVVPRGLVAQRGRPQTEPSSGWPPVEVGARVGYDNKQQQEVAGALVRIPVLRNGHVELLPNADVTFLRGLKEYQVNFEAVYAVGGREGGVYGGGGAGLRSTILPSEPQAGRQTIRTYSLVIGLKFGGVGRVSPLIEFRRVFASKLAVDPQQFAFGATFALW